jgi:hypothetical protein
MQARESDRKDYTIDTVNDEAEFERLIDRAVDVVHYHTRPKESEGSMGPYMKQTYALGNLARSCYEPSEAKRALAHATKRGRLTRTPDGYTIPGRPEGEDDYKPTIGK